MVQIKANSVSTVTPARYGRQAELPALSERQGETDRQDQSQYPVSDADIKEALGKVNRQLAKVNNSLHFEYNKDCKQLVVKIVDNETGETVKQYPSEEFLDMMARISDFIGMILDEKA